MARGLSAGVGAAAGGALTAGRGRVTPQFAQVTGEAVGNASGLSTDEDAVRVAMIQGFTDKVCWVQN